MDAVRRSLSLLNWIFFRLPLAFSLTFTALTLGWIFYGFAWANEILGWWLLSLVTGALEGVLPHFLVDPVKENLNAFFMAAVVVLLFFLGLLLAYNLSALLNWLLVKSRWKPMRYPTGTPQPCNRALAADPEFAKVDRIGIVLAGGGAKGAFQAGAMKAIYRYLEQKNALGKVKVIVGTSIGSWNSLFWLADLIKPDTGWQGESIHQRWWQLISAKSLTAPSWYVPFLRNAFLSSEPWKQVFDHLFLPPTVTTHIVASPIHFYLTRSNVRTGTLECATNNPTPPPITDVFYDVLDPQHPSQFMADLRTGVFASMDLPPLFPYTRKADKVFEDGGVIDNVPLAFAAVEGCDLIFVLPLNSDFEETPNETSIFARLFRVMDVRQGVLERNGFKMVYLYNEITALRQDTQALRQQLGLPQTLAGDSPLATALRRTGKHINIFAVCPERTFVNNTISTQEFWKRKDAATVFRTMDNATWGLLQTFHFDQPEERVRMALVSEGGQITWDEEF